MSDNYTKLFSSITESTVWGEPYGTRLVWIAFLAKCNKHGEVYAAVPGVARWCVSYCLKPRTSFNFSAVYEPGTA